MRALALLGLCGACTSASPDPGLDSVLEIPNAQYRPGPFPADEGGPGVIGFQTRHTDVLIGRNGERATSTLEAPARAAVIGIAGYDGAWIVIAGPPEFSAPGLPTANVTFGVRGVDPGPLALRLAATDQEGRTGAAAEAMIVANAVELPAGELVIHLEWQGRADLDLHVVDADGGEVWTDKPNSGPPPQAGVPTDPTEYLKHGILEHDGNKDCHKDGGTPFENVIWTRPPPSGAYLVRVDARAMCGAPAAPWSVSAYRGGQLLGSATGLSTIEDTQPPPGETEPLSRAGQGVLALRFSL